MKELDRYRVSTTPRSNVHYYSAQIKSLYPGFRTFLQGLTQDIPDITASDMLDFFHRSKKGLSDNESSAALASLNAAISTNLDVETGIIPQEIMMLCFKLLRLCTDNDHQAFERSCVTLFRNIASNKMDGGGCIPGIINRLYLNILIPFGTDYFVQQQRTQQDDDDKEYLLTLAQSLEEMTLSVATDALESVFDRRLQTIEKILYSYGYNSANIDPVIYEKLVNHNELDHDIDAFTCFVLQSLQPGLENTPVADAKEQDSSRPSQATLDKRVDRIKQAFVTYGFCEHDANLQLTMDVLCTMDGIESFEDELFYSVIESAISDISRHFPQPDLVR